VSEPPGGEFPAAIPAATTVILRDRTAGLEVLILRKNSGITFGGMWVFPGGRIDDADRLAEPAPIAAAAFAAARETREETGLDCPAPSLIPFAEWTPPPSRHKRFQTWFFATSVSADEPVIIDGAEVIDHQWARPEAILEQHASGHIDLTPPTWVTVHALTRHPSSRDALRSLGSGGIERFSSHARKVSDTTAVVMWHGDAGYEDFDPHKPGPRHRLTMVSDGDRRRYTYERDRG
jgi:8-oxo-dGTP pyrophosphatase MutT (NUDIX family)